MGSKERLETELALVEVEDIELTEEAVRAYIAVSADELLASRIEGLKMIKEFSKNVWLAKINNFFYMFTGGIEDYTFYEAEIEKLDEEVQISLKFSDYHNQLLSKLDEDNFFDIYKFVKLTDRYYSLYLDQLEEKRKAIYYSSRGIGYLENVDTVPSVAEFNEFFTDKVDNIGVVKGIEKNKKM